MVSGWAGLAAETPSSDDVRTHSIARVLTLPRAAWEGLAHQFPEQARLVLENLQADVEAELEAELERACAGKQMSSTQVREVVRHVRTGSMREQRDRRTSTDGRTHAPHIHGAQCMERCVWGGGAVCGVHAQSLCAALCAAAPILSILSILWYPMHPWLPAEAGGGGVHNRGSPIPIPIPILSMRLHESVGCLPA